MLNLEAQDLKGVVGELGVCKQLETLGSWEHVRYIHNMPLKSVTGHQQVDIVALTEHGFFAIEVKNWNCRVYCSQTQRYWTLRYSNRELVQKSPVIQNEGHLKYLRAITERSFQSVVVFPDTATLFNQLENTMYVSQIQKWISRFPKIYCKEEIESVYHQLLEYKRKNEVSMLADLVYNSFGGFR